MGYEIRVYDAQFALHGYNTVPLRGKRQNIKIEKRPREEILLSIAATP